MSTIKVTDATFEEEVLKSNIPVVVDFWAEWCGPCRAIAPVLEELSKEFSGKVKIVKLNVDENQNYASQYGIRSIPTLIAFKNGELVNQVMGGRPKPEFVKWLNSLL